MSRSGARSTGVRARVIRWSGHDDLEQELREVGCSPASLALMLPKASFAVVKVTHISCAHALIFKQAMLSAGGDAAIPFDCINAKADTPSALVFGTEKQIREAVVSLSAYGNLTQEMCEVVDRALGSYLETPKMPDLEDLCHPCQKTMFRNMARRTLIMGIINVTPDSFSDGGEFETTEAAVERGIRLAADGADILDIGGESTRPGSDPVTAQEELERILPVVQGLKDRVRIPLSVDTSKAEVAEYALMSGAHMLNDVTGLKADPEMAAVAAHHQAPIVIMHSKGKPKNMQDDPSYDDLMGEIHEFLDRQVQVAIDKGVAEELIFIDPGFGFGKTAQHNLELLKRLSELRGINRPILIGTSRKSTLGKVTGTDDPLDRLEATASTVALAIAGGAQIVRVHDVQEMSRVVKMTDAVVRAGSK